MHDFLTVPFFVEKYQEHMITLKALCSLQIHECIGTKETFTSSNNAVSMIYPKSDSSKIYSILAQNFYE